MDPSVAAAHDLVTAIQPIDVVERHHRDETLRWLESTDDVYRREKPAVPSRHLVCYTVVCDPADGSTLLVDHRVSGLWLPAGGHVDPHEHPRMTATREAREELSIDAVFLGGDVGAKPSTGEPVPLFVTVSRTATTAHDPGHDDVSLWFVLVGARGMDLEFDGREFPAVQWCTPAEVRAADPARLDPHYLRFLAKLTEGRELRR